MQTATSRAFIDKLGKGRELTRRRMIVETCAALTRSSTKYCTSELTNNVADVRTAPACALALLSTVCAEGG
eukprot:3412579-Pleurochrysis_carterae.AAC.1